MVENILVLIEPDLGDTGVVAVEDRGDVHANQLRVLLLSKPVKLTVDVTNI